MDAIRAGQGPARFALRRGPHNPVVLDDHARLPWRFFGRLTAAVQAGLTG